MSTQSDTFAVDDHPESDRLHSELDLYKRIIDAGASEEFWSDVLLSAGYYSDKEYWQQVDAYLDGLFAEAAFGRKLPNRAVKQVKLDLAKHGFYGVEELTDTVLPSDWGVLDEEQQEALLEIVEEMHPEREDATAIHRGWHDLDAEERAAELERLTSLSNVPADQADAFRRRYLRERGEEIWSKLSPEAQVVALADRGGDIETSNAFWRMVAFRHDASMSKGARGWDNLTRRVSEKEVTAKGDEEEAKQMLGLGGGV